MQISKCINKVRIQNKMKSKKKLIYKLHENLQENPFKPLQETSFRNVGVKSYDFNKMKSIRAISLRGLAQAIDEQNYMRRDEPNQKNLIQIKINEQLIQHGGERQHQLICSRKKVLVDRNLINVQEKKLYLRKKQKQQNPATSTNPIQSDYVNQHSSYEKHQRQKTQPATVLIEVQKSEENIAQSQQHSPTKKNHSRHVSLPQVNKSQSPGVQQQLISLKNQKQKFYCQIQEQKARQHALKQLRLRQDEKQKLNKKVMMSIKLKSMNNLQRIARSQSEAIKIDKWKQKYGQKTKNENKGTQVSPNKNGGYWKVFLPQIQRNCSQRYTQHSPSKTTPLNPNNVSPYDQNSAPPSQQYQSPYQNRYSSFDHQSNNLLYQDNQHLSNELQRQYSSMQPGFLETTQQLAPFDQYYSTQMIETDQSNLNSKNNSTKQSTMELHQSQPFKITVTKMKKYDSKNKQNLNLFKTKDKLAQNVNNIDLEQLPIRKMSNAQNSSSNTQNQDQSFALLTHMVNKKAKQLKDNSKKKYVHKHEQLQSPLERHQSKEKVGSKVKINQENDILVKVVEQKAPMMEWQNQRYADIQDYEFANFVKNQKYELE